MKISTNSPTKKTLKKSVNGFGGENITAGGAYGSDDMFFGEAFGDQSKEFGGIDHFAARVIPTVSHD